MSHYKMGRVQYNIPVMTGLDLSAAILGKSHPLGYALGSAPLKG